MTMIERVARAMWETFRSFKDDTCYGNYRTEPHWEEVEQFTKDGYMLMARAAIEAMREPAGVMTVAMITTSPGLAIEDMDDAWRAAIDAALKEDKA